MDQFDRPLNARIGVLEHVVAGGVLSDTLEVLCREAEATNPEMRCSVLLLDRQKNHLRHAAAPSLPDYYVNKIDGLPVAKGAGSCGSAAYQGECVIVDDVHSHAYWEPYRNLAEKVGFAACWSQPIFSKDRQVLGTFAMYFDEERSPGSEEVGLIQEYAQLASLAIERELLQFELQEINQRLKQTATLAKIGYWVWDDIGDKAISCSEVCARIHGISVEEYVSMASSSEQGMKWVHPDDREEFAENHRIVTDEHRPVDITYRLVTPSGDVRWVREIVEPEFDSQGEHFRTLGSVQDISEQKQINDELRRSHAIQEAILSNVTQGISMADSSGRIIAFNKRFLEINDFPPSLFGVDTTYEDLVRYNAERGHYGSGDVDHMTQGRVGKINSGESSRQEKVYDDGRVVEIRRQSLPDGSVVITDTDVTDRYQIENSLRTALAEAEEASQAKSAFLAAMSHEFRTPLNAILGFAEMLAAQYFGPLGSRKYLEYTNDILESGKHMFSMVNDLLDLATIEAGERTMTEEWIGVAELISDAVKGVVHETERQGVAISTEIADDLPLLHADRRSVFQIALNLLSNAVKFTGPGGEIVVSVSLDQVGMALEVRDTGVGIHADRLETITQPFTQAHENPHLPQEGAGLGLSIVDSLVAAHGGSLTIKSEFGKGTEVRATFPKNRVQLV